MIPRLWDTHYKNKMINFVSRRSGIPRKEVAAEMAAGIKKQEDDSVILGRIRDRLPSREGEPEDVEKERGRATERVSLLPSDAQTVLDFGSGDGYIAEALREKYSSEMSGGGGTVTTLDIDPSVKPDVLVKPGEPLPLEDESFDLVTLYQVLHHVPSPEGTLRELDRILRPGGYLYLREHDVRNQNEADYLDGIVHGYFYIVCEGKPLQRMNYRSKEEILKFLSGYEILEEGSYGNAVENYRFSSGKMKVEGNPQRVYWVLLQKP